MIGEVKHSRWCYWISTSLILVLLSPTVDAKEPTQEAIVTLPLDIAMYAEETRWIQKSKAIEIGQRIKNLVENRVKSIAFISQGELPGWIQRNMADGEIDVVILFGEFPHSIYPSGNAQPDGSLAELFLEDGNMFLNTAGYIFWRDSQTRMRMRMNREGGLQNMMDSPELVMDVGKRAGALMNVTSMGRQFLPSLKGFRSANPIPTERLNEPWVVDATFASDGATHADPVVMRHKNDGGRIAIFYQNRDNDLPRAEVISEFILNWMPTVAGPSVTGEINTADGFNAISVNQETQFVLTLKLKGINRTNPITGLGIYLPDEWVGSTAKLVGTLALEDGKQLTGDSSQTGKMLEVQLNEQIDSSGKVTLIFEAGVGGEEAATVDFAVKLFTDKGTALVVRGADVNGNPNDTNGLSGIVVVNADPVRMLTGISAEPVAGENDVQIAWTVSSDERVNGYEIYGDGSKLNTVYGREKTRYKHINATPGDSISYTVVAAVNGVLKSPPSETVGATVGRDTTPPEAPLVQVERVDAETVELSWTSVSKDTVRYQILRGTSRHDLARIADVPAGVNTYVDETDADYLYTIDVIDDQGNEASKPLRVFPFFSDVAAKAGVDDRGVGQIAASGDYDADGYPDLYVGNLNQPHVLYRNNGDGTFANATGPAGIRNRGDIWDAGFVDYDNDGHLDLYVINHIKSPSVLYHNNGDGTFTDVIHTTGIDATSDSHRALFMDYDNDGHLDIYIMKRGSNILYRNNGNNTFTDVTDTAGVGNAGAGWDGAFLDYDNDGDMDLFMVNHIHEPSALYRNNGDGTFSDVNREAGLTEIRHRDGCAIGDYNNDGYLDILVVTYHEENLLYRNNGDGTFTESSATAGLHELTGGERAIFVDYDNDGYLDLYLTNHQGSGPDVLYRNNGDGTFSNVTQYANLSNHGSRWGTAFLDYDGDGDIDLYIANSNAPNELYRNNAAANNWLHVKLLGKLGNRSGIGARVKVKAGTLSQIRQVGGSKGESGQSTLPVTFGLGQRTQADELEIRWASGNIQTLRNVPANQIITVTEQLPIHDLMVTSILAPGDVLESSTALPPRVQIRNMGAQVAPNAKITCLIKTIGEQVYSDTQTIENLASLEFRDVRFTEWTPEEGYAYDVEFVAELAGDLRLDNNRLTKRVSMRLFRDTTQAAGLGDERGGNCVTVSDYDGDGDLDIYSGQLYQNNGDGTFSDVTAAAGITPIANAISARFGNLVGDNQPDLIVTDGGRTWLYRNNGDGTFTDVTNQAGGFLEKGIRALALADYDGDGRLDIYIARIGENRLYRNNGDTTFTDVTEKTHVGGKGWSEAAVFGDYDGDNGLDIYVANWGTANVLYRNNGDGTFSDVSSVAGIDDPGSAKDASFWDYNEDGKLDIIVANGSSQPDVLFRNNGDGSFTDVTRDAGLGEKTWAEAVACGDYDGDGHLDLYLVVSNGTNLLYRNNGDGTFSKAGRMAGVDATRAGTAVAFFDADGDGDLDLFIANLGQSNVLYHNTMHQSDK